MTTQRTLSSGEMVRESGLSIKALRLYGSRGLLVPAHVDPRTGYRGYTIEQVERARRIALLRRLDLPLARVAEVLDADTQEAREILLTWWVQRCDDLAAQRTTALDVARLLGIDEWSGPDAATVAGGVRRREVPERTIATITSEVTQADLVPVFTADVLAIRRHLQRSGAQVDGGHWVIYHQVPVGGVPGRIETCVPYTGAAAPQGDIVLRVDPARTETYLEVPRRDCGYPQIVGYHEALGAAGRTEPRREVYTGTWSEEPDEIVAEVSAPVAHGT